MSRVVRLVVLATGLAALRPLAAAAADCDGGSLTQLRVASGRLRLAGTVTRRGLTHDTLVGPAGLTVALVDANDGTVVFETTIPRERVASGPSRTRYDRAGSFPGTLTIQPFPGQADTVRVRLRVADTMLAGTNVDRELRAVLTSGAACARTCVASCSSRGDRRLACRRSAGYVPAAADGFGALRGDARRATSAYCGLAIDTSRPCDFLIDERCLLPYPSSHFLAVDPTTPTGLRIAYGPQALPRNARGKHIDPTDWNTLDGFSPGPMILALFPDTGHPVDLVASNAAFHTDFARSLDAEHPTVLMRAADGARVLHFAEMDANTDDVTRKALIVRPGRRLDDGTRYLVAMRRLVDTEGTPIRPRLAFRALRDGVDDAALAAACGGACAAAIAARRPGMEDVFATLAAHGVARGDLLLAWDFTTASTQALTGWIRAVRDQAFALGTPAFTVTSVDDGGGAGRNADIYMRIEGTFQAPLFMTADAPASRLNLVAGVPTQNGWATVRFVVDVPRVAVNVGGPAVPGRPTLWGHGLLGNRYQLTALSTLASLYNFVIGAVDMQGMSDADVGPAIIGLVQDFSSFHYIPERLHQGFLNHLLLGRLMVDPVDGFNSHPAFQVGGVGVIDTTEVYYSGGSQGGIFGAAIMSIAEDFKRGFLAVPGANYSLLLHRSIDFNPFLAVTRGAYPDRLDEQLNLALIQQLWDRAEPQGYLNHLVAGDLSDPPVPHKVLIHMATYDSEVTNLATEVMVRSLGIPQVVPAQRSFFQIPGQAAPFDGSAFVEVDPQRGGSRCHTPGGSDRGAACATDADCPGPGDPPGRTMCASGVPPLSNTAPVFNNGAHGSTGNLSTAAQIDAFLRPDGTVEQTCAGPCDPE